VMAERTRLHIDDQSAQVIEKKKRENDSLNYPVLNKLFQRYGYPGYDLVGRTSAHNYYMLVLHQWAHPAFQDSVLIKMKEQVDKKNANASEYALLVDMTRQFKKLPQLYGTQVQVNKDSTSYEPKPVADPDKLNERRKSIGLSSIEEYIEMKNSGVFEKKKKK